MMKDTFFPVCGNVVVYNFANRDVIQYMIGQIVDRNYGITRWPSCQFRIDTEII